MSKALISILIPFKNTEAYISECITSIIQQSYENWEAIFIDDHSNDASNKIVQEFLYKESRIQLYPNRASGIIAALQTAFSKSSGNYITRMDSDDIMTSNRLEVMLESLIHYGKQHIAVGQVKYFRADGISDGYLRYEKWLNGLTKTGSNYTEIYKECVIPSPCWMIHKEDFIACEGFEPNRYPEDYDLTFRFYRANYKCISCSEVLLYWRDYSTRTSRTHVHYAQNYFLDIKVYYFLELDYNHNRPLAIWGAGKKGKTVARLLLKYNIPFYWICNNPKKIGKYIYNQKLLSFGHLATFNKPQSIITVANDNAQKEIRVYLKKHNMLPMKDYFFFC